MDGQQQKNIHVLLIEDEAGDAGLIRFALRQAQHVSFQVTWMSCLRELHEWEQNTSHSDDMFDIVLLDLNLPDSFGLQTIQTVQTVLEAVPVVVLTGHHDTEFALQTLEAGVQDYLLKENIAADQLERAIRYALSRHELEQALEASRERMELALDGAGLGTWDWTIASDRLLINLRWRTMLGYQDDSTIANIETTAAWRALIHPEDRPRVEAALLDHLEGRSPIYEQEYRMCHVAGHWVWIFKIGRAS
ncbi:MAG: response regulator, partial [Aquaspirillum sp.]